jgi:hypothetical protein
LIILTALVILILGLFAIHRFSQLPVSINVTVQVKEQTEPESSEQPDIELSSEIRSYIAEESEEWAREARSRRAKQLMAKLQDSAAVLTELKREDYIE